VKQEFRKQIQSAFGQLKDNK
jgi:hypothetical protein